MIYFIKQAKRRGAHVKIGYSSTAELAMARLHDLQVGNSCQLKMVSVLPGTRAHEKLLHQHFKDCHVRGEWFKWGKEIKALAALSDTEFMRALAEIGQDAEAYQTRIEARAEAEKALAALAHNRHLMHSRIVRLEHKLDTLKASLERQNAEIDILRGAIERVF